MSDFHARLLTEADRAAWEALWSRSGAWLGQQWDYLDCVAGEIGKPVRVGVFSKGNTLIAGIPFIERRVRSLRQWRHPVPAPFAGLMTDTITESFLRDVLEAAAPLISDSVGYAEIISPPTVRDIRGFLWSGRDWSAQPHYNYTNRIDAPDALEKQCENSGRRQMKKAQEAGCRFNMGNEHLPALLKVWQTTRQRHGIPEWVTPAMVERLIQQESIQVRVAIITDATGVPLAGAIVGLDKVRAYYLVGASEGDEGEGSGAPSFLHRKLTEALFAELGGAYTWDWVGANTATVAQFKKKFRPELEMSLRCFHKKGIQRIIG